MEKNLFSRIVVCMLAVCSSINLLAQSNTNRTQIPEGYYDSLKGKNGAALKNAVYEIIKDAKVLSYGSGNNNTWWGFWLTDRTSDGRFIDRYSPESAWVKSTSQGKAGSGMNIEHSFPKSWWGGAENQAYCDLYNLMPCESGINTKKSNYPMGKVENANIADNGMTKVGKGSDGQNYWEPGDEWKGDFARGYMYMATCYQNFTWIGSAAKQILEQGNYPTLQEWAYKLFIQWAKADEPTQLEITRNNAVSKIQGNRNPFVDFPNLMEYIWGDSINRAFDPSNTVCTDRYSGDDTPVNPGDVEELIYKWNFKGDACGFTVEDVVNPFSYVWQNDATYGWKATGYSGKANATESYLVSPVIDLTNYSSATMSMTHALNYLRTDNITDCVGVEVRCDGQATSIFDRITWPEGTNWNRVSADNISLTDFAGKKIQLAFHYKSTADNASTWEIFSMYLMGKRSTTAIDNAKADNVKRSDACDFEFFTIDGRRLDKIAGYKGIVVVKQGNMTWKIAR